MRNGGYSGGDGWRHSRTSSGQPSWNGAACHVDDREFLFHAGDGPGGIDGVVSGGIGIHLPANNDETTLVHIGRAGLWFGYGPLLRGGERSPTFSVMEPSGLLHVTLPALAEFARS